MKRKSRKCNTAQTVNGHAKHFLQTDANAIRQSNKDAFERKPGAQEGFIFTEDGADVRVTNCIIANIVRSCLLILV